MFKYKRLLEHKYKPESLTDNPVNRVMVIKRDKGKASPLITVFLSHDIHLLDFTKLTKVLAQVFLIGVFFDSTNKNLFNSGVSAWSA